MWDKFLQHVGWKFPISDVEAEVRFPGGSHIHLTGQIVLHNRFGGILKALEIALDMGRWKNTIAIDIDEIDIWFGEAQECQLFAGLSVLGKVTIFTYITRVLAITGDSIVLYKAFATMLTGIGSFARIYVVAVVQGDLLD